MDPDVVSRRLTVEDLYAIPDDGRRYELQAGFLLSEPLPGMRHGRVIARIVELLAGFVRPRRLGVVFTADTGYILARDPDTLRGPDVSFLSWERFQAAGDRITAHPGPPDLAVEVLSPTDRPAVVHSKVADYLAAGTPLVWVVDPHYETVEVYTMLLSPRCLLRDDLLEGGSVLPGFSVGVAELFEI